MEYRSLGRSGINVSAIGFGCGGNAQLMVDDDEDARTATIASALRSGINFFDTAPAYGQGRSETNLGRCLHQLGASPVLSTKVILQKTDLRDARSAVLRSVEASLSRLGAPSVDVLVLHNRVFEHTDDADYGIGAKLTVADVLNDGGVLSGFEELRSAGLTKALGFTGFGGHTSAITRLIDTGAFAAMNVSISLLNPTAALRAPATFSGPDYEEIALRAEEAGMGVMAIQVLARGKLTSTGSNSVSLAKFTRAANKHGETLSSMAIRYVLSKAVISTAVLGFSTTQHVTEAVAAVARGALAPDVERALDLAAVRR